MAPGPIRGEVARQIKLPHSSASRDSGRAFCRVLTRVAQHAHFSLGFEGRIFRPGAVVERSELPDILVVLESTAGPMEGRKRQTTWILWLYEDARAEWREVARASALGWEWAMVLRTPAFELLQPKRGIYEVLAMARTMAEEIAELIVGRVETAPEEARVHILAAVYDRLAGEIAKRVSGGFPPLEEERRRPAVEPTPEQGDDDDQIPNTNKKRVL